MVYSEYKLQRILYHSLQGFKPPTICRLFEKAGLRASWVGIPKFLKKYQETGSIPRRPRSGCPSKITTKIKVLVEQKMRQDDETVLLEIYFQMVQ